MIKTALLGLGKTGIVVAEHLLNSACFDLVSVICKPNSPKKDRQLSEFIKSNTANSLTIKSNDALKEEIRTKKFKIAIDFTTPEASLANAKILAENGINIVIGTNGFNNMQVYELKKIAQKNKTGIVYAPNISLGINLLLSISKTISRLIPNYDVEITEYHHRHKKDSPSGTALKIANEIATARGVNPNNYVHGRKGNTTRATNEIGIHAIRAGGIVGVHKVLFAGEHDELEIIHRSYSRLVFAEGALRAASFIANHKGFYYMEEVINNEEPNDAVNDSSIKTKI
ncbi:MAG TPA: 4-hydroxy-tetrahydrodipicolinate reductase [Bacillota bacterium]|nr:4-hydroxy-tetrahydrodipicolinate reductase [Bacillota bacterium]HPO98101.1 4-hydroxy-tetrahydrodipicolinate reductase [Bacillota bacterium]